MPIDAAVTMPFSARPSRKAGARSKSPAPFQPPPPKSQPAPANSPAAGIDDIENREITVQLESLLGVQDPDYRH